MNNTLNTQQPKPDPKGKAIASFVLGVISTIGMLITAGGILYPMFFLPWGEGFAGLAFLFGITMPGSILSAIVGLIGLIFGIKGIKSSKKNFAITGIVLCGIVILSSISFWIVFLSRLFLTPSPSPPIPSV